MSISRTIGAIQDFLGKINFKNNLPTTEVTKAYSSCSDNELLSKKQVKEIKNDLDELGDQVQAIEAKMPGTSTLEDGTYTLQVIVADGEAEYGWVETT